MAYITKEEAAVVRKDLKKAFPEIKFSVRIKHYTTLDVAIMEAPYDFAVREYKDACIPNREHRDNLVDQREYFTVNHYHLDTNQTYAQLPKLQKIAKICLKEHWDKSEIQTDYFHCAFYLNLAVGKWDKPYKRKEAA
jgi:hypothetical protein|tara:strand:+ start:3255 stop:3665 length:411 start_codon:yes stop_codon:yes gene_type:complete